MPVRYFLCNFRQIPFGMKKLLLLLAAGMPAPCAIAQHGRKAEKKEQLPPPRVWIKNTSAWTVTTDEILANPEMTTDSVGCRVSGFTVSLVAPGHPFYGPLYAVGWQMTDVQKGVIKQWKDYDSVTMYIQDIHMNCHESDATSPPITYKIKH